MKIGKPVNFNTSIGEGRFCRLVKLFTPVYRPKYYIPLSLSKLFIAYKIEVIKNRSLEIRRSDDG